jgi:hypothetical protein
MTGKGCNLDAGYRQDLNSIQRSPVMWGHFRMITLINHIDRLLSAVYLRPHSTSVLPHRVAACRRRPISRPANLRL